MHDITQGELTVDGTDVISLHGKSLRKFRRKIGMIFQSFNLITRTTVIKNVLTAFVPDLPWWRATLGIFTKAEKMKALEALDQMGILDKAFVRADPVSYTHLHAIMWTWGCFPSSWKAAYQRKWFGWIFMAAAMSLRLARSKFIHALALS